MLTSSKKFLLSVGLLGCIALPLHADQLAMPNKDSYQVENAPVRGSLQSEVLKRHGEPASKVPGVGKPSISSWVYPDFKVFFENDKVLHTLSI